MKHYINLLLFSAFVISMFIPTDSHAVGYLEQKDNKYLATIERNLVKTPKNSNLFNGSSIPAGADLNRVRIYLDEVSMRLKSARSAWDKLSTKARGKQKAQQLIVKFNEYQHYGAELSSAYKTATGKRTPLIPTAINSSVSRQTVVTPESSIINEVQKSGNEKEKSSAESIIDNTNNDTKSKSTASNPISDDQEAGQDSVNNDNELDKLEANIKKTSEIISVIKDLTSSVNNIRNNKESE